MQKAQQQHMTSVQKCVQTADSISLDQHLLSSRQVNWRDLTEMYVGCAHCMLQINAFVEFSKVSLTELNSFIQHHLNPTKTNFLG